MFDILGAKERTRVAVESKNDILEARKRYAQKPYDLDRVGTSE